MKSKNVIIALAAALTLFLNGCAKSNTPLSGGVSSILSDPFAETSVESVSVSESAGESGGEKEKWNEWLAEQRKLQEELFLCGAECTVNNGEPLVYRGEPITLSIKVSAYESNPIDMSLGVTVVINNTPQLLEYNGEEQYMPIFKGIKAGETYDFEVTLEPTVAETDLNTSELPVFIYTHRDPDYVPPPNFAGFIEFDTSQVNITEENAVVRFESKPASIPFKTADSLFEKEASPLPAHNIKNFGFQNPDDENYMNGNGLYSLVRLNGEGLVNLDVWLSDPYSEYPDYIPGDYLISAFVNNAPAKLNGEYDCAMISVQKGIYLANIDIEAKAGDVIEMRAQKITNFNANTDKMTMKAIVMEKDYVVERPWEN